MYLLIPKGVSELLEIDETLECILATEQEDQRPVLKYKFSTPMGRAREMDARPPSRRIAPKQAKVA